MQTPQFSRNDKNINASWPVLSNNRTTTPHSSGQFSAGSINRTITSGDQFGSDGSVVVDLVVSLTVLTLIVAAMYQDLIAAMLALIAVTPV